MTKDIKTKTIKGRELKIGDRVQLEEGGFKKVTDLVKAPMHIEFDDGTKETPKWAYLTGGDFVTICRDDEVTVAA